MLKKYFFLIALITASFSTGNAAEDEEKHPAKLTIAKPTEKERSILLSNRPHLSNIPDVAPSFIIKDTRSKFMITFGGFIKPIFGWDMGNVIDDISFIPSKMPVPALPGHKTDYFANPMHSGLDFHIIGLPGSEHQIGGYVNMMYNAPKAGVQVHHVYITYRGFLLGKTSSLFVDEEAIPHTIDPQGPNGALSGHSNRFSFETNLGKHFRAGISAELPAFDQYGGAYEGPDYPDLDGIQYYEDASQPIPDIPAFIEYQGKGSNRVRISGIIRNFFYRDQLRRQTRSVTGWGVQLSGNLSPAKPLIFYYEAAYGEGIGHYIQDLCDLPLSYLPQDNRPGKMRATPMMGWLAGFNYHFPCKLVLGYTYSEARIWDSSLYFPEYKYGQYMAANLVYPIRSYFTCGIEWLWGRKKEYSGTSAHINRIQTAVKFSF
ncbi:MAG: hypothetical protein RR346_01670 [Bacteroidales bacterium]